MSSHRLFIVVAIVLLILILASILLYSGFNNKGSPSTSTSTPASTTHTPSTTMTNPSTNTWFTHTSSTILYTYNNLAVYRGCIDEWCYSLIVYPNCTGLFTIVYNGSSLTVENPLLPLTAGLQFIIVKSTDNVTVRKPGMYYYNQTVTIKHGDRDSMRLDLSNALALYIYGKILGKIPFNLYITLHPLHTCMTTSTKPPCSLILEGVYSEPRETAIEIIHMDNGTLVRNGVVEVFIYKELSNKYNPVIKGYIRNIGDTPLIVSQWSGNVVLLNISSNGVDYTWVNKTIPVIKPQITVAPIPCNVPEGYQIIYQVLYPGEKTEIEIHLVNKIDDTELKGWMYLEITLEYTPIKELYSIKTDNAIIDYAKIGKTYNTKTITITTQVHRS